jgi:hypothetical protein
MHSTSRFGLLASVVFLPALALPSAAVGQYRLPEITAIAKADSVHGAAQHLAQTTHRWRDAARLHRQSATLRTAADSLGYRCFTLAAQLSFAGNDLSSAQSAMVAAAGQALARGDVVKAANAFADAAWIADQRHNAGQVRTFARRAEVLAASPLLTQPARAAILRRFAHSEPALALGATH